MFSHARVDRFFDRTAAFSPILEGADVVHFAIAHILEHLAAERRAPARSVLLLSVWYIAVGVRLLVLARSQDREW